VLQFAAECRLEQLHVYRGNYGAQWKHLLTVCDMHKQSSLRGTAVCDACPANSNTPLQSTASTVCKFITGYDRPDGSDCTTCAMGKYKAHTGHSATGCDNCESGQFLYTCGNGAEADCLTCPVYSGNSPAASTDKSKCACDFMGQMADHT